MTATYHFDLLTSLFSTGANSSVAEIRASAVRGELRWWFRILGGFADDERSVAEQEKSVFGGVSDGPSKSKLTVRVERGKSLRSDHKDADALGAGQNTPLGYLLFPLRSKKDRDTNRILEDRSRGFFHPNDPSQCEAFSLHVVWTSPKTDFPKIQALISIWGQLGSLGFRSRRCMGALAFHGAPPVSLSDALLSFATPDALSLLRLDQPCNSADNCTNELSKWLKGWRSHGRAPNLNNGPGFQFAKIDHDAGLDRHGTESVMRPPLGLPIIQKYSGPGRPTNEWTGTDCERFASPVLLRPLRTSRGDWVPLVIFVENRMWPQGRDARITYDKRTHRYFDRPVSTELINAMRNDHNLRPFASDEA